MLFIYNLLLPILALVMSPVIFIAFLVKPKFRAGFWEKIGFYSNNTKKRNETFSKRIIFHAVSVGEVNAICSLVKRYRVLNPNAFIVLTTTTKTGQEVAQKSLGTLVNTITYFPYDFWFSVKSFLNSFKPSQVVIAETEIWPCFASVAHKMGIRTYIVNGRISPNSHKGYKKFRFFFSQILSKYQLILMQSLADAERIVDVGAPQNSVKVMGNLKYDIEQNASDKEIADLKEQFKSSNYRLFLAASTHAGEDEIVLEVFKKLKNIHPDLKLLVAPRHPQRFSQVETLVKQNGFNCGRRSNSDDFDNYDVMLLDTMGELSKIFAISKFAFIGGSYSNTGGHNPLEANIWGKPVITGPNVFNFKDVYNLVVNKGAAIIVGAVDDFETTAEKLLSDDEFYSNASRAAESIFRENRGAIDFVLGIL